MSKAVILIAGTLAGIGREPAFVFAQEWASLAVNGRREDAGRALVAELRALGAGR